MRPFYATFQRVETLGQHQKPDHEGSCAADMGRDGRLLKPSDGGTNMPDVVGLVAGLLAAIVVAAVLSVLLQWLWNAAISDGFSLQAIAFWQAHKLFLIAGRQPVGE
jgi:hypothetical protein